MNRSIVLEMLVIGTLTTSQIPESFSEDILTYPPCNVGVFVSDDVQCHTVDSPPCPTPSIEKMSYVWLKKMTSVKDEIC